MKLSIVSTLYYSAPFLDEFIERCLASAASYEDTELILVDDGSPDDSLLLAKQHASKDSRIIVIELSRNFGHHKAILAGLAASTGDRVFFVDCDLEEPPESLSDFTNLMEAGHVDVVFGITRSGRQSIARRITSSIFWKVFNWASRTPAPVGICNIRLMTRDYVDALVGMPETNVFLGGLFHWVGFKQIAVPIERKYRQDSSYSVRARLTLAVRSIVSFSTAPLRGMFWLGLLIATASAIVACGYLAWRFVAVAPEPGFAALIISLWFLGGAIISGLGLLGIYIAYLYDEVKGRPRVVIRKVHRRLN
jgi:putative glycosyltransferase